MYLETTLFPHSLLCVCVCVCVCVRVCTPPLVHVCVQPERDDREEKAIEGKLLIE